MGTVVCMDTTTTDAAPGAVEIADRTTVMIGSRLVELVASPRPAALAALAACVDRWPAVPDAPTPELRVALGGDGCVLRAMQLSAVDGAVCFGGNCGHVGFLANPAAADADGGYRDFADGLEVRLGRVEVFDLAVLDVAVLDTSGESTQLYSVNDMSLWRAGAQAAKLTVSVNGVIRVEELVGDGLVVSTPAGSTGYNLSAGGPILPLGVPLLSLTPLNAYRPRRWPGAILADDTVVEVEVLTPADRPVSLAADQAVVHAAATVRVARAADRHVRLAFDPDHRLDERITAEQFAC